MRSSRNFAVRFSVLLLITFGLAGLAYADAVDDLVRARMQERNIPGAAVAVIKDGKVVKIKGYGLASIEFNAPVTLDTVFEIGSVSKQMTAAGIMLLVQDGKVNLDEKISKYLPNTPDAWKDVTVRHLLTHTSGIKSYTSLSGFELSRRVKIDGFIKQLSGHPLEFTPGEKNIYSNSGFNLLAYIIETQSGQPYMDFMRTRIFTPLGMTKTADRDPQFIIPFRANGYEWRIDHYTGRDGSLTDLMGAGSIVSTIGDMVKWDAALRGNKFLTAISKREIWTKFIFNDGTSSQYGFGWRISDVRGTRLIGHTGQTAGFGSAIFRYADDDTTVIALTNLGESGMGSLIASSVAKVFFPQLSIKKIKIILDPDPARTALFLSALKKRLSNDSDQPQLAADLFRSVTSTRVKGVNNRIVSYGSITKFSFVGDETVDSKKVYRFVAASPKRSTLWRFATDTDGRISEMTLEEEE
jgi:CubicO group peptidase (beta-lactamase class C family)